MSHLIGLGVDMNYVARRVGSNYEETPLHTAATFKRMEENVWLLEHGADMKKKNGFGQLPTFECRMHIDPEMRALYEEWEAKSLSAKVST